jgi:hypothetical protein
MESIRQLQNLHLQQSPQKVVAHQMPIIWGLLLLILVDLVVVDLQEMLLLEVLQLNREQILHIQD